MISRMRKFGNWFINADTKCDQLQEKVNEIIDKINEKERLK